MTPKRIELDDELIRLHESGMTSVETGKPMGVDYKTVLRRLREHGIEPRSPEIFFSEESRAWLRDAYLARIAR